MANGTEVGGKHVRVDRAKTQEFDHTRSVFLGNLPMDVGDEEVGETTYVLRWVVYNNNNNNNKEQRY